MKKIFIYSLLILLCVGGKVHDINTKNKALFEARQEIDKEKERIIESIKIDGIDESYDGQIVIELDGNYYEYKYTTQDSTKDFICKW